MKNTNRNTPRPITTIGTATAGPRIAAEISFGGSSVTPDAVSFDAIGALDGISGVIFAVGLFIVGSPDPDSGVANGICKGVAGFGIPTDSEMGPLDGLTGPVGLVGLIGLVALVGVVVGGLTGTGIGAGIGAVVGGLIGGEIGGLTGTGGGSIV